MKLSDMLKKHLRDTFGVAADATDDVYRDTLTSKLLSGELTAAKVAELNGDKASPPDPKAVITAAVAEAMTPVVKGFETLSKSLETMLTRMNPAQVPPVPAIEPAAGTVFKTAPEGAVTGKELMDAAAKGGAGSVRVIGAHERYENTRKSATYPLKMGDGRRPHPFAGQRAQLAGRTLDEPSDLDKAICGVYLKWSLQPQVRNMGECPRWLRWTEHDQQIFDYMLRECAWNGLVKATDDGHDLQGGTPVNRQKLTELQRKDLLDDSTSGGINAVPLAFDDAIVLTPVLFGELFPLVEVVNLARGRLIDGSSMSNPTFTSGTAEGTAITPFSTTSFIAAMDSTIFPVVSAVKIGLDFEEDTPIDIGGILVKKFGEKLMEWLDNQIANGDGTTEIQGFFNASGTTTVATDNGTGGPGTVGDLEAMRSAVNKAYRNDKGGRVVFVSNDTTYGRYRGIPVGPSDERRVFGMAHDEYMALNYPWKVQNDIGNSSLAFINLAGFRLYRRLGMSVRMGMEGSTLQLANERLITVRGRFGGRLTLGGYASISSTAQA